MTRSSHPLLRALLALLLCFFFFLAALPSILSTEWGKKQLLTAVNARIAGTLEASSLSISWLGPQIADEMVLKDPQGLPVASLSKAKIDASLFKLLQHPYASGLFEVQGLNATLTTDAQGISNFERALFKECCPVSNNSDKAAPAIVLKEIQAYINLSEESIPLTVKVHGNTQQGNLTGKFNIDGELKGATLTDFMEKNFAWPQFLEAFPEAELTLNADIVNFPMEVLDQLIAIQSPELEGLITQIIGTQLNLTLKQTMTHQGFLLDLNATSPLLTISAEGVLAQGFSLKKPATLQFKVAPTFFARLAALWPKLAPWKLSETALAILNINHLEFPLEIFQQKEQTLDFSKVALQATLDMEKLNLKGFRNGNPENIDLQVLHATLETQADLDTAAAAVSGKALRNGEPMNVEFTATLPKSYSWDFLIEKWQKQLAFKGNISGLPIALIDEQMQADGMLLSALGEKANLDFSFDNTYGRPLATIKWRSDSLGIAEMIFAIEDKIELIRPTRIAFQPTALLQRYFGKFSIDPLQATSAEVLVKKFSLPFSFDEDTFLSVEIEKMLLDLSIDIENLVANLPETGPTQLNNTSLIVSATPFMQTKVALSADVMQMTEDLIYNLLGEKTHIAVHGILNLSSDRDPSIGQLTLNATSPLLNLNVALEKREGGKLMLAKPVTLRYQTTNQIFKLLNLPSNQYILEPNSIIDLSFLASHIPLQQEEFASLRLHGILKVDALSLKTATQKSAKASLFLQEIASQWSLDVAKQLFSMDFNGIARMENQSAGKISGSLAVDNWLVNGSPSLEKAEMRILASTSSLPTEIIALLSAMPELPLLAGNALDLSINANLAFAPYRGFVKVNLDSPTLNCVASLTLARDLYLKSPATLTFRLTPQNYQALRYAFDQKKMSDFTINEPATISLQIKDLHLPFSQSLWSSSINASFKIDKLVATDNRSGQQLLLKDIQGQLFSQRLMQQLTFNLSAAGTPTKHAAPAEWNIQGSIDNGWLADGTMNMRGLSLSIDGTVNHMPASALCDFACSKDWGNKVAAVIGPLIDAKLKIQMQQMTGPVYMEFKGKNGQAVLDAFVVDGLLTLKNNLQAQVAITPELSRYVLQDFMPIATGIVGSNHLLKLTIDHRGFSLPLHDLSPLTISIGRGTLDLGQVTFSGTSQIAKVLSLLTPADADNIKVWLTPAYFSLNGGTIKLERLDMLINDYFPLAAWGNVDMANDKVNMIVGITGTAIAQAFKVYGINSSYMLQLPLKGHIHNASIDKTKAAARLSALVAQTHGGPHALVGTVLDIATGGLSESQVPPSTTNPLPWGTIKNEYVDSEAPVKGTGAGKSSTIKEIGKEAESLLKKLFR